MRAFALSLAAVCFSPIVALSLWAAFSEIAGAEEPTPTKPSLRRGAWGGDRSKLSSRLPKAAADSGASPAELPREQDPDMPRPPSFAAKRARAFESIGDEAEAPGAEQKPEEEAIGEERFEEEVEEESEDDDEVEEETAEEQPAESTVYGEAVLHAAPKIAPPAELELLPAEGESLDTSELLDAGDDEPPAEPRSRLSAPLEAAIEEPYVVQPAGGQHEAAPLEPSVGELQPLAPLAPATARPGAAAALLDRWLKAPPQRALAGQAILLSEAIQASAGDRARQLAIVKSYWSAACQIAEYHLALADSQSFQALAEPEASRDRAAWLAARSLAEARLLDAELAAVLAQQDLALACGMSLDQPAPLPADPPFVGNYATKFQALFQGRPAPESVRRIDRILPLSRRVVEARAAAATALEASRAEQIDAYEAGQATIYETIAAANELRAARGELLSAVRSYNHAIADYALYVAAPGLDRSLVVKMLIVEKSLPSVLKGRADPAARGDRALAAEQALAPAAQTGRWERAKPAASAPAAAATAPARVASQPTTSPVTPPASPQSPLSPARQGSASGGQFPRRPQ